MWGTSFIKNKKKVIIFNAPLEKTKTKRPYPNINTSFLDGSNSESLLIPIKEEDIAISKDQDGKYGLELTKEQMLGSSNVKCKVGTSKKSYCSIDPFILVVGDKVLSADKLVVNDYNEGENLIIANGNATNLKLTDKDSETSFNKSETGLGDAQVKISFGKKEKKGQSRTSDYLFPWSGGRLNTDSFSFELNTSRLVHTVSDPNNPSESKVKWKVKDGGPSIRVVVNNENDLSISAEGETGGGLFYDSDPFSKKSLKVNTTSMVKFNLKIDNDPLFPKVFFSFSVPGKDIEGENSVVSIQDDRAGAKFSLITAKGRTSFNLSQKRPYDEKSKRPIMQDEPLLFELGSDSLYILDEPPKGDKTEIQLEKLAVKGEANINKGNFDFLGTANSINLSRENSSRKRKIDLFLKNDIKFQVKNDETSKSYSVSSEYAYYTNSKASLLFEGRNSLGYISYKDKENARTIDQRAIENEGFGYGQRLTIKKGKSVVEFNDNVKMRQINFQDGGSLFSIEGTEGVFTNNKYRVKSDGKFSFTLEEDKQGKVLDLKFSTKKLKLTDLLMDSSRFDFQGYQDGMSLEIGPSEVNLLRDRESNETILLNVDLKGKLKVDRTKLPIRGEANFSLKGKNLTKRRNSFSFDGGNSIEKQFSIIALGQNGKIDHARFSAGPSFFKNAISIKAEGGKEGGKELTFSFKQDKKMGTYYMRAEFKEGETITIKFFPFKLESKKNGKTAKSELFLEARGQNYMNHMKIINSILGAKKISNWLDVSENGMIIAKTSIMGGLGLEVMYKNKKYYNPKGEQEEVAATYGLGVSRLNSKRERISVGLMLSGDSQVDYRTNANGDLKILGVPLAKNGSLASTLNIYSKKEYTGGDKIYGGLSLDIASLLVDEKKLDPQSNFFKRGRNSGKFGGTISYLKKINKSSNLILTAGANNNFSNPSFCFHYEKTFGGVGRKKKIDPLVLNTVKVLNYMAPSPYDKNRMRSGPNLRDAILLLRRELDDLRPEYDSLQAFRYMKRNLEKTMKSLSDGFYDRKSIKNIFNLKIEDIKILKKWENKNKLSSHYSERMEEMVISMKKIKGRKEQREYLASEQQNMQKKIIYLAFLFENKESFNIMSTYKRKLKELSHLRSLHSSDSP